MLGDGLFSLDEFGNIVIVDLLFEVNNFLSIYYLLKQFRSDFYQKVIELYFDILCDNKLELACRIYLQKRLVFLLH